MENIRNENGLKIENICENHFQVIYNDEDQILYTNNLSKALEVAKSCAKWEDHPCTYAVYCENDSTSIKIVEYVVKYVVK